MKRSEYRDPAICINCKHSAFIYWMQCNLKTEETRTKPVLDCFLNRRIGLIETGNGQAKLWGWATISGKVEYNDRWTFYSDEAITRHCVNPGRDYGFPAGGKKYGYSLTDFEWLDKPVLVPVSTYTGDRTARDLHDFLEVIA